MPDKQDLTNDIRDEERLREALTYARNELIGMANRAESDEWLADVAGRAVWVCTEALAATDRNQQKEAGDEDH